MCAGDATEGPDEVTRDREQPRALSRLPRTVNRGRIRVSAGRMMPVPPARSTSAMGRTKPGPPIRSDLNVELASERP